MVAFRPLFRPNDDFVVLIPITLGRDKRLQPGTVIKKGEFPRWRLRSWYNRRLVAKADSAYAEERLTARKRLQEKRERTTQKRDEPMPVSSNALSADVEIAPDHTVSLGDVVRHALEKSGLSVDDWHALEDEAREVLLVESIQDMRAAHNKPRYRIEKKGAWFTVFESDEQVGKVQGQVALDEWMKAREGEAENGG